MSFIDDVKKTTGTIGGIIKKTYGPLSALELPTQQGNIYRYPLDVGDSRTYPHTVEFQAWLPTPVGIDELGVPKAVGNAVSSTKDAITGTKIGGAIAKVGSGILGAASKVETKFQDITGINLFDIDSTPGTTSKAVPVDPNTGPIVNRNQTKNSRLLDFTRRAEKSDLIALYLPNAQWQDSVDNSYEGVSVTEAFGNAGLLAEAGSSLAEGYKKEEAFVNKIMSAIGSLASSRATMEVLGKVVGSDNSALSNLGLAAMGVAINPQQEMLYGGTSFREFSFEFIMTPRTSKEAEAIKAIIKKFKYHASPQYTTGQGRYVIPPSYFDITFKFNGAQNPALPLISTCALKNVTVQYNNGLETWASYEDGMPVQVQMTLSFVELEMMHKALREEGY